MPLSAVDSITVALEHSKRQLFKPFRMGQWARLALVGFLAGELSSGGGCNAPSGNFNLPQTHRGSQGFLDAAGVLHNNPALLATLIAVGVVVGILLWLGLIYLNSMMRFVLFDSVVAKECHIREYWARRAQPGFRYFIWQVLFGLAVIAGLIILLGIPAAIAFGAGWLKAPSEHLAPLILGGIFLFFVFLGFFICAALITVFTKDFVVPLMALEDISVMEGWRRLWSMLKTEQGGYAGYIGMKIVMAIAAGIIFGILTFIIVLIVAIPVGGVGVVVALIASKTAGLTWNAYTITLLVVAGCVALAVLLYLVALVSVPVVVFFPAYSIHFFASRYPALDRMLHPAPPDATPIPPVVSPAG